MANRAASSASISAWTPSSYDAVSPPYTGILTVGTGTQNPLTCEGGELKVATVMRVAKAVDHRVIDGAHGAQPLEAIVQNLENPLTMLA